MMDSEDLVMYNVDRIDNFYLKSEFIYSIYGK